MRESFPFLSHFTMKESDEIESLRDKFPDHRLLFLRRERRTGDPFPARNKSLSELMAYLARNPRRPQEAA